MAIIVSSLASMPKSRPKPEPIIRFLATHIRGTSLTNGLTDSSARGDTQVSFVCQGRDVDVVVG
ncbi:hypothetical protein BJX70DRAFT_144374 [Aspergillus crustosus]